MKLADTTVVVLVPESGDADPDHEGGPDGSGRRLRGQQGRSDGRARPDGRADVRRPSALREPDLAQGRGLGDSRAGHRRPRPRSAITELLAEIRRHRGGLEASGALAEPPPRAPAGGAARRSLVEEFRERVERGLRRRRAASEVRRGPGGQTPTRTRPWPPCCPWYRWSPHDDGMSRAVPRHLLEHSRLGPGAALRRRRSSPWRIFAWGMWQRIALWRQGGPEARFDRIPERVKLVATHVLGQARVLSQAYPGVMHAIMFWGFLALFMGTVAGHHRLRHHAAAVRRTSCSRATSTCSTRRCSTSSGSSSSSASAWPCGGGSSLRPAPRRSDRALRLGAGPAVRDQPHRLHHGGLPARGGEAVVGARGRRSATCWARPCSPWAWARARCARPTWACGSSTRPSRWSSSPSCRTRTSSTCITTPLNIFFSKLDARGARSRKIENIEEAESLGVSKLEEFSWKRRLDFDACVECGRCQAACPAYLSGTALSPQADHRQAQAPHARRAARARSTAS